MIRNNTIALVALGMVIGSIVTGLLFWFLSQDRNEKEEQAKRPTGQVHQPEPEGHTPPLHATFARDIKGDCTFSGTVEDRGGKALENAMVRLRLLDQPWSSPDPPIETRTNANGQFQLSGLSEKMGFQLWVWAPGYSASSQDRIPCGSHTRLALDRGATLELTFTDSEGNPLGPARVQLIGSNLWPARLGYSSPDGKLTLVGLEAGEYIVWADTKHLASASAEPIPLEAGQEAEVTLVLSPTESIRVVVTDEATGNPVPAATALIGPSSTYLMHKIVLTGEDGSATVSTLPKGDYTVTVIADGFQSNTPVPFRFDTDNLIALKKGISISGTVRNTAGDPISGAVLEIQKGLGKSQLRLPPGRGEQLRRRILDAASSGWPHLYQIEPGSYVPGPRNIPVPAKFSPGIAADRANRTSAETTDDDGNFRLDSLPSGKIILGARHPDFVMTDLVVLTLQQGKNLTDIEVVMRRGTTVSARVLDERGYPVRDAEVTAYSSDQEPIATANSDSYGVAVLRGLPGIFRIVATAPERVPAGKKLRVRTGTENEVTLTLPSADKRLRGRVLNQQGYGIPHASVTARAISKGLLHAVTCQTESDGTFELEGMGSGSYHVTADAGEQGRAQVPDASFDAEVNLVVSSNLNGEQLVFSPTDRPQIPFEESDLPTSPQASDFPALRLDVEDTLDTVRTPFGDAETLAVTGPPSGKGSLPITIGGRVGNVLVTHIRQGSRVAMAGLSKGDRIVAIDDRKVTKPAAARRALEGPIGSVVTLTIENRGEQFTVIVQRVRAK